MDERTHDEKDDVLQQALGTEGSGGTSIHDDGHTLPGRLDVDESSVDRTALGYQGAPAMNSAVVFGDVALTCGRDFARLYFGTTPRGAIISTPDSRDATLMAAGETIQIPTPVC